MQSRFPVRDRLEAMKSEHRTALMPFLTIGWPDAESFVDIALSVASSGADVIELGMPFSDPVADGPVIQRTSKEALDGGMNFTRGLELMRRVAEKTDVPLVLMTYYNPLLAGGLHARCKAVREAGARGLIVPDLPPDEGAALEAAARPHDLDISYLIAPTSSRGRIQLVCLKSRGFVYLVAAMGVTGAREEMAPRLKELVDDVRRYTLLPLCIGFGVSTPAQAREVGALADGCIVGSALLQAIADAPPQQRMARAAEFTMAMREALDKRNSE
jgi:tryptophan synthase alpha chain